MPLLDEVLKSSSLTALNERVNFISVLNEVLI